jgi:hypothetical protein
MGRMSQVATSVDMTGPASGTRRSEGLTTTYLSIPKSKTNSSQTRIDHFAEIARYAKRLQEKMECSTRGVLVAVCVLLSGDITALISSRLAALPILAGAPTSFPFHCACRLNPRASTAQFSFEEACSLTATAALANEAMAVI